MNKAWTVTEAKAQLSEIMRRASQEGPQIIGVQKRYVLVPEECWKERQPERPHFGKWLVENAPRAIPGDPPLELPNRNGPSNRPIPFADEWEAS